MTDRTSLNLTDERMRLLEEASEIVANGPTDDPPRSDVIDAALTHLIESHENLQEARGEYEPGTIKAIGNTSVLRLYYRTDVESPWRS
jgi:metal-responsive CopG/Arc/MetJ family transcriptional regulator